MFLRLRWFPILLCGSIALGTLAVGPAARPVPDPAPRLTEHAVLRSLPSGWGRTAAREWRTGRTGEPTDRIEVEIPPGKSRCVEFDAR